MTFKNTTFRFFIYLSLFLGIHNFSALAQSGSPQWMQALEEAHRIGWDNTYLVSGLSNELVYDNSVEGKHLVDYLRDKLLKPADYPIVVQYNPESGFSLHQDPEEIAKPGKAWGLFGKKKNAVTDEWEKFLQALNNDKKATLTEKLNQLERKIQNGLATTKIAFVSKFPDHVANDRGEYPHMKEYKELETRLAQWATFRNDSHKWTERGFRSIIVSSSKGNLPLLAGDASKGWVNFETKVTYPDKLERAAYVEKFLSNNPNLSKLLKVTPEEFGNLSGGLTLMDIQKMLIHAVAKDEDITDKVIRDRRKKFILEKFGQFLDIADPKHSLDDVFGSDHLKRELRILARAMQAKDPSLPVGKILVGVQGTGKTFSIKGFAYEAGVPVVILKNTFRGKYVGESEGNMTKVLDFLKSLEMVAVQLPEADTILGKGAEASDNTGVDQRTFGMLNDFMSEQKGSVFWFADSARPWNFQADTKSRMGITMVSNQYSVAGKRGLFNTIAKSIKVVPGTSLYDMLSKTSEGVVTPDSHFPDTFFERMYGNPREITNALDQAVLNIKYGDIDPSKIDPRQIIFDTMQNWTPSVTMKEVTRTELNAITMANDPRGLPPWARKFHEAGKLERLEALKTKVEGHAMMGGGALSDLELAELHAESWEEYEKLKASLMPQADSAERSRPGELSKNLASQILEEPKALPERKPKGMPKAEWKKRQDEYAVAKAAFDKQQALRASATEAERCGGLLSNIADTVRGSGEGI
jgi:hypothetical protein